MMHQLIFLKNEGAAMRLRDIYSRIFAESDHDRALKHIYDLAVAETHKLRDALAQSRAAAPIAPATKYTHKGNIMTGINDQIAADQAAVSAAQAALDAANKQLSADQAALAAISAKTAILDQMESAIAGIDANLDPATKAAIDAITAPITAQIESMRALLNADLGILSAAVANSPVADAAAATQPATAPGA